MEAAAAAAIIDHYITLQPTHTHTHTRPHTPPTHSSAFLLSWADPHVTLFVEALLAVTALAASLLLYLLPPRLLLLAGAAAVYTRLHTRRVAQLKAAKAAAGLASPRRTPRTPKPPAGVWLGGLEDDDDDDDDDDGVDWEGKVVDLDWRDWVANPAKRRLLLPSLVKNIVARAPDLPEVVHREIAARRVHPEPLPPLQLGAAPQQQQRQQQQQLEAAGAGGGSKKAE